LKKNFGWLDVWELNPGRVGTALAEGLCDLGGESFWLKDSMSGGRQAVLLFSYTLTTEEKHRKPQSG
jgi:hypothetical protein